MTNYSENILKKKINKDEIVFGTWSIIPSVTTIDIIASSGLDFIILDMEHGSFSLETISNIMKIKRNCEIIVRLPNDREDTILRVLETGCKSILIPHIKSVKQVFSMDTLKWVSSQQYLKEVIK